MKKILLLQFLTISEIILAQEKRDRAYQTGYAIGKALPWIIIAIVIIGMIIRSFRKKN